MLDLLDIDVVMVLDIRINEGGEGIYNNGIS